LKEQEVKKCLMDLAEEEVIGGASEEVGALVSGVVPLPGLMWEEVEEDCRGAVTS
jgi:hypothetical protein